LAGGPLGDSQEDGGIMASERILWTSYLKEGVAGEIRQWKGAAGCYINKSLLPASTLCEGSRGGKRGIRLRAESLGIFKNTIRSYRKQYLVM